MSDWWGKAYDNLLNALERRMIQRGAAVTRSRHLAGSKERAVLAARFDEARKMFNAAIAADKKARRKANAHD